MKFNHNNCSIIINDGVGTVYRDGKLMFKGDGYIAIKFMLQWTNNAEEVKNKFKYQLSQREQCKWSKRDEEQKYERRMKEEAERAKSSIETKTKKTKSNNKIQVSKYKIPR